MIAPGTACHQANVRLLIARGSYLKSTTRSCRLDLAQVLNAVSACVRREAKVLCRLERAVPLPSKMLTLFEPEFTARPSCPSPL